MKTKLTLFVLFAGLIVGSYWYYDISQFDMPENIEITSWAKEHVQEQLAPLKKPILASDVQKAYDCLLDKDVIYVKIRNNTATVNVPSKNLYKITYFKVMNYVIMKLAKEGQLKNNDFLISLRDQTDDITLPEDLSHVPVFVFAKDVSKKSMITKLLIVDSFTLKSWSSIYKTLSKGIKRYPWEKKLNKLYWRGKTTDSVETKDLRLNSPRISLAKLTKQFPERYDARLTKILASDAAQIKMIKDLCGDVVAFASTMEHLIFKYQITLDGVTATFPGYLWRMGSGSVNIKQDSNYVQWFYDLFKPNMHYLPVARDLSNLDSILVNVLAHDTEMHEMAVRARQIVEQELTPSKVFGYLVELLNQHSAKVVV